MTRSMSFTTGTFTDEYAKTTAALKDTAVKEQAVVSAQTSAGASAVSLAVTMDAATNNGQDIFNTREAASNPPQLVVVSGP